MHVTFILPAIGRKPGQPYIATWKGMEPLTIAVLASLTPPDVERRFFDDRRELVDFDAPTDLVAIPVEVYTARRAYAIAARYRARGIPVVLGGYHATLCPDEAGAHADAVVTGSAESVWSQVLADARARALKPRYHGEPRWADVLPDRTVFGDRRYSRLGVVETGRGCVFGCEFCAITAFYDRRYHRKPVEMVVREVRERMSAGRRFFFFADDNIVADPAWARELFDALAPLGIRWSGQGSLTLARDPDLLRSMKKSGCTVILIGYESLDEDNLRQMGKGWCSRLGEVEDLTRRIHDAGIHIYATFLFGFDHDTPALFARTLDFARRMGFFFAAFNHLLPMPGTPLYARLLAEGRILRDQWWLDGTYTYGALTLRPALMSPEEVSDQCRRARKAFYTLPSVLRRAGLMASRTPDPVLLGWFLGLNLALGREVDEKMGLPMGENLDALPK